jgi:hypothetical protein
MQFKVIACANIANLLLARATARRQELSIRVALGASRLRLARQLLAGSLLLSATGAILGLAFAQWSSRLLVRQLSTSVNNVFLTLSIDWRIVGFTAAVAIATAVVFGMAPALRGTRVQPNDAFKAGERGNAGETRFGLGSLFVVGQVALSLVLVVAAGLFVQTFASLAMLGVGFERNRVLIATINPLPARLEAAGASSCSGARSTPPPRRRLVPHVRHADAGRPRLHERRHRRLGAGRHRQRNLRAQTARRQDPNRRTRPPGAVRPSVRRTRDRGLRQGRDLPRPARGHSADDLHPLRAAGCTVDHVPERAHGESPVLLTRPLPAALTPIHGDVT